MVTSLEEVSAQQLSQNPISLVLRFHSKPVELPLAAVHNGFSPSGRLWRVDRLSSIRCCAPLAGRGASDSAPEVSVVSLSPFLQHENGRRSATLCDGGTRQLPGSSHESAIGGRSPVETHQHSVIVDPVDHSVDGTRTSIDCHFFVLAM